MFLSKGNNENSSKDNNNNIHVDVLEFHTVLWCDAQLWEISNEKRRRTGNQKNSSTTQNKMSRTADVL